MAIKVTFTSSDPGYKSFSDWAKEKMQAAIDAGNPTEAQAMQAAIDAKTAANKHLNYSFKEIVAEGNVKHEVSTRDAPAVTVAEFDVYFNQWKAQYNVQIKEENI